MDISQQSVSNIVNELDLHRVNAKFVPHQLTNRDRQLRIACTQQILALINQFGDEFFENLIVGDETHVYHYQPKKSRSWVRLYNFFLN